MAYVHIWLTGQDFRNLVHGKTIVVSHGDVVEVKVSLGVLGIGFSILRACIDDAEKEAEEKEFREALKRGDNQP